MTPGTEIEPDLLRQENVHDSLDLCLLEFCAGKALLAKQACKMLTQASASHLESTLHNSSGLSRVPRVEVVLIDRTEVRHDAFMSTQDQTNINHTTSSVAHGKHSPSLFGSPRLQ